MEHRSRVGRNARRKKHVAELRAGRIRDHALDVVLNQPDRGRKQSGRCANDRHDGKGSRRVFEHRGKSANHEDASRYHRRGVDQRRDGGRTFHRVRQPGMQEQLRRLAACPHKQQQAQRRERIKLP